MSKFEYKEKPEWKIPHQYQLREAKAAHFHIQYLAWLKQAECPKLRESNRWADNWEICGKFL